MERGFGILESGAPFHSFLVPYVCITSYAAYPLSGLYKTDFRYSQVLCGAIRGALAMVHLDVQTAIVSDSMEKTEIRVKFIRIIEEFVPAGAED
ncbi:hypothetical protein AB6A40_011543 [Gnathostoma spinigerum]|uniref:Uncharacterized protein n=1 Tax=Gnathostoma spinigerum TaxID=75299 RepID=A0ABD6F1Z1_9BILA